MLYKRLRNRAQKPKAKINHLLKAQRGSGHGIHSPYLYRFVTVVLNTSWPFYAFDEIESFREAAEEADEQANLSPRKPSFWPLRQKWRTSHKTEKAANRDIFRIVQDLQPETMLEIGTTNGISTLYMAKACPSARCLCIPEESKNRDRAAETFDKYGLNTIELHQKTDVQLICEDTAMVNRIDLVVFSATAQQSKRLEEFKYCLKKAHANSIFIVRQIHQTPENEKTWKILRQQPEVVVSIDLYEIGILLFRPELIKKHYRIRTKKQST